MRTLTVKKRSQKQENSVAKTFNARTTAASGALWGMKGDVRSDKLLIECKTTEKQYYPVTAKVWEKIRKEATQDHIRIPLLVVDLVDRVRYVVFNPNDFERDLDTVRVFTTKGPTSTFRIYSWGELVMENPLEFVIKSTSPLKDHRLVVWTEKNFLEYYEGEL